jgi:hypothetical protein
MGVWECGSGMSLSNFFTTIFQLKELFLLMKVQFHTLTLSHSHTSILPYFPPTAGLWARMDSNHRTPERTDLQSVVVGHLTTCPIVILLSVPVQPEPLSQRRESNPRPADYKSAALPTELLWPVSINKVTHIQRTKTDVIIRLFFWEGKGKRIC